jgi:SAM-dependent methyltransferase
MQAALRPDFSTVTEQPEQGATRLQLAMLSTRYAWAAGHAADKDVAEIACGAGLGLGWIARRARSVEAGDLNGANCRRAQETYAGRANVRIRLMDALDLPFPDASLDLALLFEAIYYLPVADKFFQEAQRVLRPGGMLLISTVNREWSGFNPSPFHTRYFSAAELTDALARHGFRAHVRAGFAERRGVSGWLVGELRRAAVAARLIPHTMAGKAFLKRLFYGPLEQIPRELEPARDTSGPFSEIGPGTDLSRYRALYAEARKIP